MDNGPASPAYAFPGPASLHPATAISRGWATFRSHAGPALVFMLVMIVCLCVGEVIPFVNLLFVFLGAPVLGAGGARYLVRHVRGEAPPLSSVFDGFRRWPTVAGAMLLQMVVTLALLAPVFGALGATFGLALLLHPGAASLPSPSPGAMLPMFVAMPVCYAAMAWWYARTWPLAFLVMEPGCPGAMEAFKASFAMTRGNAWRSVGLFLLALPLEVVGLAALCIGIFPAMLTWYYGVAHGYEMLRGADPAAPSAPADGAPGEPAIVV